MAFTAWSYAADVARSSRMPGSVFAYVTRRRRPPRRIPRRLAGDARLPADSVGRLSLLRHRAACADAGGSGVGVHGRRVRVTTALNLAGVGVAARAGTGRAGRGDRRARGVRRRGARRARHRTGRRRPWAAPFTGTAGVDPVAIAGAVSIAVLSYPGLRRDCLVRRGDRGRFASGRLGDPRCVSPRPDCCSSPSRISPACLSPIDPADLAAQPGGAGHGVLRPHADGHRDRGWRRCWRSPKRSGRRSPR